MNIATTLVGALFQLSNLGPIDVVETQSATYPFTPHISQVEACKQAENKAKTSILEKVSGQTFSSDASSYCKERNNQYTCTHTNITTESARGVITEIVDRQEKVKDWQCTVTLTAKVSKQTDIDPNYDMYVQMHQLVYMDNDQFRVAVFPNAGGALTIFRLENGRLVKLWPHTDQQYRHSILSPRHKAVFPYDFGRLPVPKYVQGTDNSSLLFFAYTAKTVNFLDSYELSYFYKLWDSIKFQKRLVRKGFIVTRSE